MTEGQAKWLKWLQERGGSGYLDQYGRLVAGGEVSPQGAQTAFLKLVAAGHVAGGQDRLFIASAGKAIYTKEDAEALCAIAVAASKHKP